MAATAPDAAPPAATAKDEDVSAAYDLTKDDMDKIHGANTSFLDVCKTIVMIFCLAYETRAERIKYAAFLSIMSLIFLITVAMDYLFPAMAGFVLQTATTRKDSFAEYKWAVVSALSQPASLGVFLVGVRLFVWYTWFRWAMWCRMGLGLKFNALLESADRKKLREMLDTPDQRIMVDMKDFFFAVFDKTGIIHSTLEVAMYATLRSGH